MREAKKGFGDEIPKQVWDWSLPPPVAETGRRNVGNRKERLRDYASFLDRQPNVLINNPRRKPCGDLYIRLRWGRRPQTLPRDFAP